LVSLYIKSFDNCIASRDNSGDMLKVKFKNTGEEEKIELGAELKDVTKDAGWPIAYGCEDGVCGTCIVKVVDGEENLNPMEETEKQTLGIMGLEEGGYRLACQCKCNGNCTIEGM